MFAIEYTPYIRPFVMSLLITSGLAIYVFRRRSIPVATTFAWMMVQ